MSPRTFVARGAALLALATLGLAACESKTVVQPQENPLVITVTPQAMTLTAKGQTGQFVALVSGGPSGTTPTVTWSSSNTSVATVDNTGKVTAVANGVSSIIASASGAQSAGLVTVAIDTVTQQPQVNPTVAISNITDRRGNPVDVNNVRGQINVYLAISTPANSKPISGVQVKLNGVVVCSQTFTGTTQQPGDVTTQSTNDLTVTCPISTQAFDSTTDPVTAKFPNGTYTMTATVLGGSGTTLTPLATTSQALVFNNSSGIGIVATSTLGPTAGPNGLLWVGGTVNVRVYPVIYTADVLNNVTVWVGGYHITTTRSDNKRFTVAFSPTALGQPDGAEGETTIYAESQFASGAAGPDEIAPDTINLDEHAPSYGSTGNFGTFTWLNASSVVTPDTANNVLGLTGLVDNGVDTNTAAVFAAAAGSTTWAAAPTAVAGFGNIVAAGEHLQVKVCDAFQNCRTYTSGNFGVDLIPPAIIATDSAGSFMNAGYINTCAPATAPSITVAVADTGYTNTPTLAVSGLTTTPVTYKVVLYPQNNGAKTTTASGTVAAGTITIPVSTTQQGYDSLYVSVSDVAGNMTKLTSYVFLVDCTAPVLGSVVIPATVTGGSSLTVTAPTSDNVDLDGTTLDQTFGTAAVLRAGTASLGSYGLPEELTGTASFTMNPLIVSVTDSAAATTWLSAFTTTATDQATNSTPQTQLVTTANISNYSATFAWSTSIHGFALAGDSTGLTATLTTDTAYASPFASVVLYRHDDVGGVWVPVATRTTGFVQISSTNPAYITTTYSFTAPGTGTYIAAGIDSKGHALLSGIVSSPPPAP